MEDKQKSDDARNNNNNATEARNVAAHYNSRPDLGKRKRQESRIINLRKYNNWVKSVLIAEFSGKGQAVLDLAGGKGGDLMKWQNAQISQYVLIDIATNSVYDAVHRYNELENPPFSALFISSDCGKIGFLDKIPNELQFDTVSCQFALHYCFEKEERARAFVHNVASKLKPGGYFIGTMPSANRVVYEAFIQTLIYSRERLQKSGKLSFGNELYRVEFERKDEFPKYGAKYYFTLEDSVDNCPEYLVNWDTFCELCEEHDLKPVLKNNFGDMFNKYQSKEPHWKLLKTMRIVDKSGQNVLSRDEWEVATLYTAFAFQKKQPEDNKEEPKSHLVLGTPQKVSDDEVLIL